MMSVPLMVTQFLDVTVRLASSGRTVRRVLVMPTTRDEEIDLLV